MKHESAESGKLTARVIAAGVLLVFVLLTGGLYALLVRGELGALNTARSGLGILSRIAHGVTHLDPRGFIECGLLVLLLTPLARLVADAWQSIRGSDWRFALIGLLVAALLIAGLLLGTR